MGESLRVERVRIEDVAPESLERLAGASFLASRGFLDLWRSKGGRPVAWRVDDAGRAAAVLLGIEYGRGPVTRFASLPDGCSGGLLVDPEHGASQGAMSHRLLDAIARHGYAKVCVFDMDHVIEPHAGYAAATATAFVSDISDPGWEPPDPKLRSQIRKAERDGTRVERFDWDQHHRGFLALAEISARQHRQRSRYSARFYRELAQLTQRDPRVRWLYCAHEGRPVASHIYFVEKDSLLAWVSVFDRAFAHLKPNPFIRVAACREARADGVRWLNLGAAPPGAGGLAHYKARWGGEEVRFPCWTRWAGLGALVNALVGRGTLGAHARGREPEVEVAPGSGTEPAGD